MPPKFNKRRNQRNQNQNSFVAETTQILKHVQADNRIYRRRMALTTDIATDGIGRINTVYEFNPNATVDWGDVDGMYDQFRVVGIALTLIPRTMFSLTILQSALIVAFDNDDITALTSYTAATDYQTSRMVGTVWTTGKPIRFQWSRPNSGKNTDLPWIDIAAPSNSLGSLKLWASALSNSTTYFFALLEYACEFRGVR